MATATLKKGSAKAEAASVKLAKMLGGDGSHTGVTTKLPAPKRPRALKAVETPTKAKPAAKKARTATVKPVKELPANLERKLRSANAAQRDVVRRILGYDPTATFSMSEKDVIAHYVPKWEQGRMKGETFVPGPGRQFVYLIDTGGELSGHGFRYRSSAAEAKLKPLEEANAKRLERAAKKAA